MGMFKSGQLPFPKPALAPATAKSVACWLAGRVPTVGLHAKGLTIGKGGQRRTYDRPELVKAKKWYADQLPHLAAPVAGPLRLHVEFVLTPQRYLPPFPGCLLHTGKPDRSNLVKLFEDALADAGWMANDCEVVAHPGEKWVSHDPDWQGVWFVLETVLAGDPAATFQPPFCVGDDFRPRRAFPLIGRSGVPADHR